MNDQDLTPDQKLIEKLFDVIGKMAEDMQQAARNLQEAIKIINDHNAQTKGPQEVTEEWFRENAHMFKPGGDL